MYVQATKEAARLEQTGNVDGVAQGIKNMQAGLSYDPSQFSSAAWWQSAHALVATQGVLADQYMQVINKRSPLAVSIPVVRLR